MRSTESSQVHPVCAAAKKRLPDSEPVKSFAIILVNRPDRGSGNFSMGFGRTKLRPSKIDLSSGKLGRVLWEEALFCHVGTEQDS